MKKIDQTNYRYAIIIDDYIYKDFSSIERLKQGVEMFNKRRYKPIPFRLAKLKIRTEEVEKIIL